MLWRRGIVQRDSTEQIDEHNRTNQVTHRQAQYTELNMNVYTWLCEHE